MAYIGRQSVIGNFVKLDSITAVNGQAAYTMQNGGANFTDYSSVNQFMVSLNSVVQSPGSSFTVSGSTLTFASNLATGDVIDFVIVFGNSLSSGVPTDATITAAKLTANAITGQTAETSIATDDTILIHDTSASALRKMTRANFVSGVGGNNTPAFRVKLSGNQSMSAGSHTKIQFNTEDFDTDNAYDNSSNYRFTPQTAGKYFIYLGVFYDHSSGTPNLYNTSIYKNGSSFEGTYHGSLSGSIGHYASSITVNTIVTLNGSSDYVEAYGRQSGTGTPVMTTGSFFGGYKLIGV